MKVIINRTAKIRLIGFLVLSMLTGFSASAQLPIPQAKDTAQAQPAPDDRSSVRVRQPTPAKLNDYRNDRDYQYGQDFKTDQQPLDEVLDLVLAESGRIFQ
jgi:hypothetical protein